MKPSSLEHMKKGLCTKGCGRPLATKTMCETCAKSGQGMKPLVFVNADYAALELRTLAQVCLFLFGHSRLAEVLNAGEDPHLTMACNMLGIPYAEALVLNEAHDQRVDDARQSSKVANFGFSGGLGAAKLVLFARKAYRVNLTEEQAKDLKRQWFATFPEMRKYFEYVNSIMGPDGATFRHFVSGRMRGGASYTACANSFFQGLGADSNGAVLFDLAEACYTPVACQWCDGACNGCPWCRPGTPGVSPLYGARVVNHVHDDNLGECEEERSHEVAHTLSKVMVDGVRPYLPDVPAIAKPCISRWWSKDARQIWLPDSSAPCAPGGKPGMRLVPWPLQESKAA